MVAHVRADVAEDVFEHLHGEACGIVAAAAARCGGEGNAVVVLSGLGGVAGSEARLGAEVLEEAHGCGMLGLCWCEGYA